MPCSIKFSMTLQTEILLKDTLCFLKQIFLESLNAVYSFLTNNHVRGCWDSTDDLPVLYLLFCCDSMKPLTYVNLILVRC